MAGSQDASENPVGVNVVPLVDIIFCLCVFFMCSFKFRAVETKFDTWLPKTHGVPEDGKDLPVVIPSEIRVALTYDERTGVVTRKLGIRDVPDDAELERLIDGARTSWMERGQPEAPLTIDADVRVPWEQVTTVVNLAKRRNVAKIEFAMGRAPAPRAGAR
jgi:biopolymer transport protein ExbD